MGQAFAKLLQRTSPVLRYFFYAKEQIDDGTKRQPLYVISRIWRGWIYWLVEWQMIQKMFSQATGESSSWAEPGAAGFPPFYFTWLLKVDVWRRSCGCFCFPPFYSPFKGGAGEAGKADQDLGEWEAPAGVAVAGEGGSDQGESFICLTNIKLCIY